MNTSEDPRIKFGLTCPVNGTFYICQDSPTRFIGCCTVDPCTSEYEGECPSSKLFAASFSSTSGAHFLPQSCASPYNSSIWYTCDHTRPPFLGCCTNNPCSSNGCLTGHLFPARLSDDPGNASQFLLPENTTDPSVTGTSIVPVGTDSPSPSPDSTAGGSERAGLIAGIAVAGVVILLLVIAAYLWVKQRKDALEKHEQDEVFRDAPSANAVQSNDIYQGKEWSLASPTERSVFLAPNSNLSSPDPQGTMPSPSVSENFNSHHLSTLSELEGSSGMIRALQPNLGDAYRGFDGRES
ncbi:hypothetical protein GGR58DRAFT_121225 [Xylaria digitata]|nr:hypothetical protein GGR58DRAFT_121225 [Xylaria digitata]